MAGFFVARAVVVIGRAPSVERYAIRTHTCDKRSKCAQTNSNPDDIARLDCSPKHEHFDAIWCGYRSTRTSGNLLE